MILVIGSLNVDLVVGVERAPNPGETLLGSDYSRHRGGKGGNQSVAAARASGAGGAAVRMVGRVGDDPFGGWLIEGLAAEGIVHAGVVPLSGVPSGVAFISVDRSGQNSIIVAPGANSRLRPDELQPADFAEAQILLLQLEVPLPTVLRAARLGREAGARVILNLAPAQPLGAAELADIDLLVVNESEAGLLLEWRSDEVSADAERAAALLTALVPTAIVTLGAAGVVWAERDEGGARCGRLAGHSVEVVDTTAAGDSFVGALAAALSRGATLAEAVAWANAAGALAVGRAGAQPSIPTKAEIAELLDRDVSRKG